MGRTMTMSANRNELASCGDMTEILPERSLREKIAEVEMANCMLNDFAALVAHDIRGGLRRVISYTELLAVIPALNGNLDALDCMHIIMASTRRIRFLAEGALASPPQVSATVGSSQPGHEAENDANSLEDRLNN